MLLTLKGGNRTRSILLLYVNFRHALSICLVRVIVYRVHVDIMFYYVWNKDVCNTLLFGHIACIARALRASYMHFTFFALMSYGWINYDFIWSWHLLQYQAVLYGKFRVDSTVSFWDINILKVQSFWKWAYIYVFVLYTIHWIFKTVWV